MSDFHGYDPDDFDHHGGHLLPGPIAWNSAPTPPRASLRELVTTVLGCGALLGLGVWLYVAGHMDFGPWPVALIVGLVAVVLIAAPISWTGTGIGLAVALGLVWLLGFDLRAAWSGACVAAGVFAFTPFVGSLAVLAVRGADWLGDQIHYLRFHRPLSEKAISREVAEGLDMTDAYLEKMSEKTAPATLAKIGQAPRRIIGLSGYAGAGKDTVAAGLIFNKDYTRVSFADKLREFALALDPLIPVEVETVTRHDDTPATRILYMRLTQFLEQCGGDWTEAKKNAEVRSLLQRIGTDAGRKVIGENVWVDAVMNNLPDGPIVFTDTRFPNEAQAVKDAGGYVIRVSRPGVDAVNAHVSETALDDWEFDGAVINEGTAREARDELLKVEDLLYGAYNLD